MKVFVGVKVSQPNELEHFKSSSNHYFSRRINWVKNENLHLTLLFIGFIPADEIEPLKCILRQIAPKHKPFNITINGIGLFKKKRKNSVLWLKVKNCKRLTSLQKDLLHAIKLIFPHLQNEHETYTPHITIARFKWSLNTPDQFPDLIKETQPISEIQLIESCSSPNGVDYKIIERYNLSIS